MLVAGAAVDNVVVLVLDIFVAVETVVVVVVHGYVVVVAEVVR